MDCEEPVDEDIYVTGIAMVLCFAYLQITFWATRPITVYFDAPWTPSLLILLLTLLPISATSITLYLSGWFYEWPQLKRALWSFVVSCAIFIVDLLLVCFLVVVMWFLLNHSSLGG